MFDLETRKKELKAFFKEFLNILDKNNLWYAAEFGTLLGAVRENKMIEWDDDVDLIISYETYLFLKKNYPQNLLDTSIKGYPFIFAKWVSHTNNFLENKNFIDLFIVIPTTKNKLKKFISHRNIFKFSNQMFSKGTKYKPNDFVGRILKYLLFFTQWLTKKMTIENVYEMLYEEQNPEFNQLINLPIYPIKGILDCKRPLTIWNRKKIKFEDFEVYIPVDYDECLQLSYGNSYMIPIKTKSTRIHIDPINSIDIKKWEKGLKK